MEAVVIRTNAERCASTRQGLAPNQRDDDIAWRRAVALTDSLRRQHRTVSLLAMRLRGLVDHHEADGDAYRVTLQLARLHAMLRLHLLEEDCALYPALLGSGDAQIVALASEMQEQSGCLAGVMERFMMRWSSSALIGSDFAAFRTEIGELLSRFSVRIEREENELYPLADNHAQERRRAA